MTTFRLAPLRGLLLWLTVAVLPLPLLIGWAGSAAGTPALWWVAGFIGAIYAVVWVYMRPTSFEITPTSLDIVWPVRRHSTSLDEIVDVALLTLSEFRNRYGIGYRIGAGGLWGGFGLYKTKDVTFQFYISHMDRFVVIDRQNDRPLMITPENPDDFAAELRAQAPAPPTRQ